MYKIAQMDDSDRDDLFKIIAGKRHVSPSIVEKDYWVCLLLDYLFSNSKYRSYLTFKGGTSLSKGFGLIQRFSEDIDLILDFHIFGSSIDDMNRPRSKNQQSIYNERINQMTQAFLENDFVSEMINGLKAITGRVFDIEADPQEKLVVNFIYPSRCESDFLLNYIRLEIGALGALFPVVEVPIKADAYNYVPNLFDKEFTVVRTVSAERTFWEKATILYHEALRPKEKPMPARYSRHYYDLFMMGHSNIKERAIKDPGLLKEVVDFKQKFYPESTKWLDYRSATEGTFILVPPEYRFKELSDDYRAMSEMIYGKRIQISEILDYLRVLEKEINSSSR